MDRAGRGRVGSLGERVPRRRRTRPRVDAVRAVARSSHVPHDLPAGPPSDDAVLVTCAYLLTDTQPWVEQSLFLAAIGEARDSGAQGPRGVRLPLPRGTPPAERFLVHRTVFPRDFLADFGFRTVRSAGRIELARLDFGGLQPVAEGTREKVLERRARGVHARARPDHPAAAEGLALGASPLAE